MNDKVTISTFQLFEKFPDQESARIYLEGRLWPNGVKCPTCKCGERITTRKGGYYRCNACSFDFTVRTGTIFGRSHVPLHKWLYAMYLLVTSRKGISSLQLSKEIGITQKSAWFLLHRLREACGNDLTKLQGIVEVDETYVGGLAKNMHKSKRKALEGLGTGGKGKAIVMGLRERNGKVVAGVIPDTSSQTLQTQIHKHVQPGSTVFTDAHRGYCGLNSHFAHEAVDHTKCYGKGGLHTNSIESVWAVFKRGLVGVYHHASKPHLNRYVNEFAFRLNDGNVKRHTLDRLDSLTVATAGRRITYKELIA
jgi:transposase-like protein